MFHCLVIKVLCLPSCDSSFSLSQSFLFVKNFFKFFSKLFNGFCDSLLISNSFTLSHSFLNVKYFFEVFYFFKIQNFKRRRRDLNPRAAINDLLPFQGSPFGQLGYFSKLPYAIASFFQKRFILYRVVFYLSRTFLTFQKFFILFK